MNVAHPASTRTVKTKRRLARDDDDKGLVDGGGREDTQSERAAPWTAISPALVPYRHGVGSWDSPTSTTVAS